MQIGLRQISPEGKAGFAAAVKEGGHSRTELAKQLCAREDWINQSGRACVSSARAILDKLSSGLGVSLPSRKAVAPRRVEREEYPDLQVEAEPPDLGEVRLEEIDSDSDAGRFAAMLATYHPGGEALHPGGRIGYMIKSAEFGALGGILYTAASWHQKARDKYIGWDQRSRAGNLGRVVNQARFLVLPGVSVPNLASLAQSLAKRRVAADWRNRYGVSPVLSYSYVCAGQAGTCYRASGWQCAGMSSGQPPGGAAKAPCSVWMLPLASDWQDVLCTRPESRLGEAPAWEPGEDADWVDFEFGRGSHPDGRVRNRIKTMAAAWERRSGRPVSEIFPDAAGRKAAYRLFSNGNVSMDDILEPHLGMTVERCRSEPVVLAVQDTAMLNFNGMKNVTSGLSGIGGGGSGSFGIPAHATLAVSESGRALGVLAIEADFRATADEKAAAKRKAKEDGAAGAKAAVDDGPSESRRWLNSMELAGRVGGGRTRMISVGDREADFWELFEAQAALSDKVGMTVRASRGSNRKVDGGAQELFETMGKMPICGHRKIAVEAKGGAKPRNARQVKLELRIARLKLRPPLAASDANPLTVTAGYATEAGDSENALEWLLLSSEGEATEEWARRIVGWYESRWTIEEFFKNLKSGMRIEDRRLETADGLRKCLAFDAVLAWRVLDLARAAKHEPDRPASDFFSGAELRVLAALL